MLKLPTSSLPWLWLLVASWCCSSCQTLDKSKLTEREDAMTKIYREAIESENEMPLESQINIVARHHVVEQRTYAFFELYHQYEKEVNTAAAESWLTRIVRERGFSTMLAHPISRFFITDDFRRALFAKAPGSTSYFKYSYRELPNYEKAR